MIYLKQITICDQHTTERQTIKFSEVKIFNTLKEVEDYRFELENMLPGKRVFEYTFEKPN